MVSLSVCPKLLKLNKNIIVGFSLSVCPCPKLLKLNNVSLNVYLPI